MIVNGSGACEGKSGFHLVPQCRGRTQLDMLCDVRWFPFTSSHCCVISSSVASSLHGHYAAGRWRELISSPAAVQMKHPPLRSNRRALMIISRKCPFCCLQLSVSPAGRLPHEGRTGALIGRVPWRPLSGVRPTPNQGVIAPWSSSKRQTAVVACPLHARGLSLRPCLAWTTGSSVTRQ